jgi:tetratricopeptide (TPR) repeat protein
MAPRGPRPRAFVALVVCLNGCFSLAKPALGQRRPPGEFAGSPQGTVILGGWLHADYGQTLPTGVTVRLETNEGMVGGEQTANAAGYFEFLGLAKTYYRLTVTAPGFQAYQRDVDLRSVGDKLVISVQLSPVLQSKAPSPVAPSSFTDSNATKNARKEYEKGARALRGGNLPEAQSHFERAVKEYPCYARAQADLAVVLSEQHQFPASEAALKKALECDPDYLDAYNELGQLYYNEKKYQDCEVTLQEGLRRSPSSWQFYYQLGTDHYHLGQYGKAEQEYLKAESLSSSVPAEIHVKLADVYLKQSAYDKAYTEMQAYVRAEPNGRFAEKLKSVIHQMESDHTVQAGRAANPQLPPPQP